MKDIPETSILTKKHSFQDNEARSLNKSTVGRQLKIADIMEQLGEFDRIHYRILIYCILISIATSAGTVAFTFILKDPKFKCKTENSTLVDCIQEKACKNLFGYQLDYDIHSLVIEDHLYCERRWMKLWGQSVLFVMSSLLSTLAMFVFEKYGRKFIFTLVAIGIFFTNVLLLIYDDYWTNMTLLTLSWAFGYFFFTNFYVYSTEVFNGKWRSVANSTFFLFNYVSKIVYVLLNLTITTYRGNFVLMTILGIIFLPLVYFLIETPYYYHKKGNIIALKDNLEFINEVNNHDDFEVIQQNKWIIAEQMHIENLNRKELCDISTTEIDRKSKKTIFNEKFTFSGYICHMALIIVTIIPSYVASVLADTIPYKLGIENIYISASAFVIVLIATNFVLMFYLHKIPRRKGNIVSVIILLIFSLIFLLFSLMDVTHDPMAKGIELGLTLISSGILMVHFC